MDSEVIQNYGCSALKDLDNVLPTGPTDRSNEYVSRYPNGGNSE